MATINIFVSRAGNSNQIKLRDSEGHNPGNDQITTDVSTGDTVVWQLDSNSNLNSLEGVKIKTNSPNNLLAGDPIKSNGTFIGTIVSTSPGRGQFETYEIGYTVPGNSTVLWDDPKLQMNN